MSQRRSKPTSTRTPHAPSRLALTATAILVAAFAWGGGLAQDAPDDERRSETRASGLVERAGTALAQIDATIEGPEEVLRDLRPEDFQFRVNSRPLDDFLIDRVCRHAPAPEGAVVPEDVTPTAGSPPTFVFYIDQPFLTMAGRQQALDTLDELLPMIMTDPGARAMIVYNGRKLEVETDLTSDLDQLLAAVERIESSRLNWDPYAQLEERRVEEVQELLQEFDQDTAIALANVYQIEEQYRLERTVLHVQSVLGRLAEIDPPKAFFYIGDILRSNAGDHYLSFMPASPSQQLARARSLMSENTVDRLVEDAAGLGVRLYTIRPEGLWGERGRRTNDARDTLVKLAMETGGSHFLNGVGAKRIAEQLRSDLSCLYLFSFSPEGFPLDTQLPVYLESTRDRVRVRARGVIVLQSESARRTSQLLSAFATSKAEDETPIEARVVPLGYDKGRFQALLQVGIPGTQVIGATWDVGSTMLATGRVREDFSMRVKSPRPGVPLLLERVVDIPPGAFEVVSVAHETTTDQMFSGRVADDWGDPDRGDEVVVSPVAVLQPARGAFLRDGEVRSSGARVLGLRDPVYVDRTTALVSVVCRPEDDERTFSVRRTLSGANSAPMPLETLRASDRCAQFRDLLPPGSMTEGRIDFRIEVLDGDSVVAERVRPLLASPGEKASAAGSGRRPAPPDGAP